MIEFLKRLFRMCEHEFVFQRSVEDQNLRAGYRHVSYIYRCQKCKLYETREEQDLTPPA